MITYLLILSILSLTLICTYAMLRTLRTLPKTTLSFQEKFKLIGTGIIAFIADTLGIGSFPVTIALSKALGTFKDEELPAVTNGAQVIPGTLESLFFLHMVHVDLTTLLTLIAGTCVGGVLGGYFMTHLSKQKIRLSMIICFSGIIALLIYKQCGFMPEAGDITVLYGWKLGLGFVAMMLCGSLTSVGIGLFAMIQAVLFLMHVSPIVAFPIMTAAGAMQQPLTTLVFLKQGKIPLKKTLILSLAGCVGILIGLPILRHLNTHNLHSLLLLIMIYNVLAISLSYKRSKINISHAPI
jgi:uncharacterized membrane protein YfcA